MTNNDLVKLLNVNLANLQVLNVKLHNYHWNVKGMQFVPLHNMTEAYYDNFFGKYDDVAERIIQIGGKPLASLKDYLEYATISEEARNEFNAEDVLKSVKADFETLLAEYKNIRKAADVLDDPTTIALAEDNIAYLEKEIWFVEATLG